MNMERGLIHGGVGCPLFLLLISSLLWTSVHSQEDYSCHAGGGLRFVGDKTQRAAIIPRGDIIVEVGKQTKEVFCRFNSSFVNAEDVFFATREKHLPYMVVNSSTIRLEVKHEKPEKYVLFCKLKRDQEEKIMCSQMVSAGYPPMDITNLSCLSINNENVNCTWEKPDNPIRTRYSNANFSVPRYLSQSSCPHTNRPFYSWCFWDHSMRYKLRDEFDLHIKSTNKLGTKTFVHRISIPEIVIPKSVSSSVSLVSPILVNISWNLTYPMDVFHFGLWHYVQSRVKGEEQWNNVTYFFHKSDLTKLKPIRMFSVEEDLPYAGTEFEFRVRIHTGSGEIKEDMWSSYDVLTIKTKPLPPAAAPRTSISSFEVIEELDMRDIYVNFRDVDERLRGGKNFHYKIDVYPADSSRIIPLEPSEITDAFFKYKTMNFTEYRFRITPVNEVGPSNVYSEVVIPNSDCMPKKTEMFTVISSSFENRKIFSLYWEPSAMASTSCPGSSSNIDSYTIFWCKKTFGYRCKKKLDWKKLAIDELRTKDLTSLTSYDPSSPRIYERNVTDLIDGEIYTFGVAANSGRYSSGIRYSSCIVDESESPAAPLTELKSLTNDSKSVLVKWALKCMSISAVPIGFNVSYCKSDKADFGHCTSEVRHIKINSPSSNEILIQRLDAGVSYIFSVAVLSIIGGGSQSAPKKIDLREDIPSGPPLDVIINRVTNTSITLSWDAPLRDLRGGRIKSYQLSIFPLENKFAPVLGEGKRMSFTLNGLMPFTSYKLKLSACNSIGCGYMNAAHLDFKTVTGAPSSVDNFILDTSNWRLMWGLKRCNSRNCSFELRLPVNETKFKYVSVSDKETLSLREEGIQCNFTHMSFGIRAKGQDAAGEFLYSNWSYVAKDALDCPPAFLRWWVICIIVFVCATISVIIFVAVKFGWRTIMKAIKDCKQSINIPKGIQVTESAKEPLRDFTAFPSKSSLIGRENEPPHALLGNGNSRVVSLTENRSPSSKVRADSVSSDEVRLIESTERHGRNMSGSSSGRSSGQDSAVVADDIRALTPNSTGLSSDQVPGTQETALRQRSPGPPYVQHGIIPEKISEGYITAWSVPSLPRLCSKEHAENPTDDLRQSTPDLKSGSGVLNWRAARRASTGYISMPDSDIGTDHRDSKMPQNNTSLNRTHQDSPTSQVVLPSYSRYHFNSDINVVGTPKSGYVTLNNGNSSPPTSGNSVGYVSAGDPFGSLKHAPSPPQGLKISLSGEKSPPGTYCQVGSNRNSATQGYVSASCINKLPSPKMVSPEPPFTSYEKDENSLPPISSCNNPTNSIPDRRRSAFSPYVELKEGGRWALPIQPRPPSILSAPVENTGSSSTNVANLPRPDTTEAAIGHSNMEKTHRNNNPCLSKQSSGYVSQETIIPCEGVLMSPKRLLTQATSPHTVVLSPSHEASMV